MSRFGDRIPSGVTLTRLDLTEATTKATEWLREQQNDPEVRAEFGTDANSAAVEVGGVLYVLCEEGVGQEVTDEQPLVLEIYSRKANSFGIMPVATSTLTPAEVRALMTGEQVRLEDFVRRFGARLEANYSLWANRLNPARNAVQSLS